MTNETNSNRRRLLQAIGGGTVGGFLLASPIRASAGGESNSSRGEEFSHDVRGQNSGVDEGKIVIKFFEEKGEGEGPAAEVRTKNLKGRGAKGMADVSIPGGEYRIKAKGILKGERSIETERVMEFPPGGIPAYTEVAARISGESEIDIIKAKI